MPIDDSRIRCDDCQYAGHVLSKHHGYKWWALPVGFLAACSGVGLIPLAILLIWVGNRTYQACPQCGGKNFITWTGPATPGSDDIWFAANDADARAFKLNKLVLLATVLAMLAAAIVYCFWLSP